MTLAEFERLEYVSKATIRETRSIHSDLLPGIEIADIL